MHYVGMVSQTGQFDMEYHPGPILASIVVATVAAFAALLIIMLLPDSLRIRLYAAVLIAVAVNGMHYTG
eukprot:8011914-Heterocapsa_arctica.AAC.1